MEEEAKISRPIGPVALVPHRLLPLEGADLVVLAERSSAWCLLTRDEYAAISALLSKPCSPPASVSGLVDQLWEAGLLQVNGSSLPDRLPPQSKFPSALLLKLTGACNYSCTYCYDYDEQRFRARLGIDEIQRSIDFLCQHRSEFGITFHGGEPLLRFDLLRKVVAYAVEAAEGRSRLRFAIQTNGALLDSAARSFLAEHDFSVGISLDGKDDQHNRLRPTRSRRSAFQVFADLLEEDTEFVKERCGVLAVVSRASLDGIPEFALWLQEIGIAGFSATFLDLTGRGAEVPEEKVTPDQAVALYTTLVRMVRSGEIAALRLSNIVSRIDNLFTFRPQDFCHKGPCAASGEFLVLDAEGQFRSCDCIYHPYFELGSRIEKTTDHQARAAVVDRHSWLRSNGANCRTCSLFGLCGGTCVAKALASNGKPDSIDPIECAVVRYLYPEVLGEFSASNTTGPLFSYYNSHRPGASNAALPS